MNVFVVGGTGFLGHYTVRELLAHGHNVTSIALPHLYNPDHLPSDVKITLGDINTLSDDEVRRILQGMDGLIFAAGVDDRVTPPRPAYPFFRKGNVESTGRLIRLAREAGVKKAVIFNSYFAVLDLRWPELEMVSRHPYVRSRREQIDAAIQSGGTELSVCFLMLPYIFGSTPGRVPLWKPLIDYINSWLPVVLYPTGGSAMVSVQEVACAAVAALEHGQASVEYPICTENRTWREMIQSIQYILGKRKPIITIPKWILIVGAWLLMLGFKMRGKEHGLNLVSFVEIQTRLAYLNPNASREELGYPKGELDVALADTVAACLSPKIEA